MCVCVCVSVQASLATSCLPQYNGKQASCHRCFCVYVCACVCASVRAVFVLAQKKRTFFGNGNLCKVFRRTMKSAWVGQQQRQLPHLHTQIHIHTQTHRDKYSYWACKKRRHNYCPYNWLAWLSKAHKGSARTLHNN